MYVVDNKITYTVVTKLLLYLKHNMLTISCLMLRQCHMSWPPMADLSANGLNQIYEI